MLAIDIDLDELYRLADAVAKALWIADSICDIGIVVELFDIVWSVACDGGGVAVVG